MPPVLVQLLQTVPTLHEVVVLLTVRHVPVSTVAPEERLLVRKLDFEVRGGGAGDARRRARA